MRILVSNSPIDPWQLVQAHQDAGAMGKGDFGATAVFVGTMRDFNEGEPVQSLWLEHYEGMTQRHLERIASEAKSRWPLLDMLIAHRIGRLTPGDPIVVIAVWSAHRAAAFDACRYIMEDLKSRAPFWKKEEISGASRWVEKNTSG